MVSPYLSGIRPGLHRLFYYISDRGKKIGISRKQTVEAQGDSL
jgi:hypothetical protein